MMPNASVAPVPDSFFVHQRRWWALLAAWAGFALFAGASGLNRHLPLFGIPLAIVSLVLAGVVTFRVRADLRATLRATDVRVPILYQAIRTAFGLAFLWLNARGELPPTFAVRAGYGDIVAGLLALGAAFAAAKQTPWRRALVLAWNTFGLADIVLVFGTAQYEILIVHDSRMLRCLGRFPFSTLPWFVVPAIVLAHLWVFWRLRSGASGLSEDRAHLPTVT